MRAAGAGPPSAWTLGAGGDGKLLLVYATDATPADVIEGVAIAWLAAHAAAPALGGGRLAAGGARLGRSIRSHVAPRRRLLRDAMDAAGWQCDAACSIDDMSRRVEWADGSTVDVGHNVVDSFSKPQLKIQLGSICLRPAGEAAIVVLKASGELRAQRLAQRRADHPRPHLGERRLLRRETDAVEDAGGR